MIFHHLLPGPPAANVNIAVAVVRVPHKLGNSRCLTPGPNRRARCSTARVITAHLAQFFIHHGSTGTRGSITPAVRNARISFSIRLSPNPLGDLRHQSLVIDPIEELLQIQDPPPSCRLRRCNTAALCPPPDAPTALRTKPIAVFGRLSDPTCVAQPASPPHG